MRARRSWTAFADNEIDLPMEDLILLGGVDTSLIRRADYDSIGPTRRMGSADIPTAEPMNVVIGPAA